MKIYDACIKHNVIPGIHTHSLEFSQKYKEIGFKMIMLGAESRFIKHATSEIKSLKPVEPYKGKGIKDKDQYVIRKEGKKK